MSLFSGFNDAPGHIKTEGETMSVTYRPGVPATGQATVEWTIPGAAQGCGATEDGLGAYCGVVLTLYTMPPQVEQAPVDGVFYTNDPTADPDKFSGDFINGAMVIGAFYEGEKRARGEELTTSLVIQDIQPNTQYFVAAYAVDCQGRYHTDGVRAFSSDFGRPDDPSLPSVQIVEMNEGEGVLPSDGTNLVPGQLYEFDVEVNSNFPDPASPEDVINVKIDGSDAQTYEDLLDAVNSQLALSGNPVQSPVPPDSGSFYVDTSSATLNQFDGTTYDEIDALFELNDPTEINDGTYWFNPETQELLLWQDATGGWESTTTITYPEDPTTPQCDDYWFDGTQARMFNGTVWCDVVTLIDTDDPAAAPGGSCGLFWYNNSNMVLSEWDENTSQFLSVEAITYPYDPRDLPVDTYWFNDVTNELSIWDGSSFMLIDMDNFVITSQTPIDPPVGLLWFDPEHETLQIANAIAGPGGVFTNVPFIIWHEDPSTTESCDLWWNTTDDTLMTWDVVNGAWEEVATFVQQDNDPTLAVIPELGTFWHNPDTNINSIWNGSEWNPIPTINFPTDPRNVPDNTPWLNSTDGTISIYNNPNPGWNVIDPIDSTNDPSQIAQGTYWFSLADNTLFERIGSAWVPIPYTAEPITPIRGCTWYDTANGVLNVWNGSAWVPTDAELELILTEDGNLAFRTSQTGSCAATMVVVPGEPQGPGQIGTGFADFHSYGHFYSFTEDAFVPPPLPVTDVSEEGFLFNNIPGVIQPQTYGQDGVPGQPMYDIVGVGTDGTPDERRELSDSIRAQLGHPVVEVELTPMQLDTALQGAIESLRKRSDIAYERGFFFLDVDRGSQRYLLTNEKAGFNRIVGITSAHRFTSAFLSSAHGSGVYGQIVLQHLYNMGTYDLTSFHLVAQYIEQLEHLFATRLTFNWHESSRELMLHQSFVRPERILLDTYVERTEQELLKDRWCKTWIEKYALAESRIMLSEIRGKFGSLPGAGGGISLNAADLAQRADADKLELYQQLDDYVASNVEDHGMGTQFVIG